jgi:hypothetical protein
MTSWVRRATGAFLLLAFLCGARNASAQQYYEYTIESQPQTIIPTTSGYVPAGTPVTTQDISYGETGGYYFCYWTINGIRQAGVTGAALTGVTLAMTNAETAVAVFTNSTGNELPYWYQLFWFDNTNYTTNSNPTGDRFTIANDLLRDYSPVIANVTTNGGAILRLSDSVTLVPTIYTRGIPTIITAPTASAITYGQALSNSSLTGGAASVAGSFSFTTPSETPSLGTALQSVTFTPTDTADYNTNTTNVNVTVNKATPMITTTPSASAIIYGQALSNSSLSGGVGSVPGSFAFTTPSYTPSAGTASQSVTFTPADTIDYNTFVINVSVTVGKETPTITVAPTASVITYGQALSNSSLGGGVGTVPGNFAFTTPSYTPSAGTSSQSVIFTPTDMIDYNTAVTNVNVTVNRGMPILTWSTPASIPFGIALSSNQLNATANVPGGTAYNPPTGTVLNPGTNALTVTFTPTDTADYNSTTDSVSLVVTAPFSLAIAPATLLSSSNLQVGTTYQLQVLQSGSWVNVGSSFVGTAAQYAVYLNGADTGLSYRLAALPIQATAILQVAYGFVVGATVTSGGDGYTTIPSVSIVGGGGSGAGAVATVSNGVVTTLNITNAGSGYTGIPVIDIAPPSSPTVFSEMTVAPAFRLDCAGLTSGLTYQLKASPSLSGWTNFAPAFLATSITNSQYFNAPVGSAFFRLLFLP